nr:hypothetical protein [Shimia sp. R11_0]
MTQFDDFPMEDSVAEYPSHREMAAYFRAFADHFDLRRYFHFSAEVLHASAYRHATQFANKRVLVVGAGNSGCDIAVDAVHHALRCDLSMRRGYYFVPKYVFGRPADTMGGAIKLPMWLKRKVDSAISRGYCCMRSGRGRPASITSQAMARWVWRNSLRCCASPSCACRLGCFVWPCVSRVLWDSLNMGQSRCVSCNTARFCPTVPSNVTLAMCRIKTVARCLSAGGKA